MVSGKEPYCDAKGRIRCEDPPDAEAKQPICCFYVASATASIERQLRRSVHRSAILLIFLTLCNNYPTTLKIIAHGFSQRKIYITRTGAWKSRCEILYL
jgi:hypothetical protein